MVSDLGDSLSVTILDFAGLEADFEDEPAARPFASVLDGAMVMECDGGDAKGKGGSTGSVVCW